MQTKTAQKTNTGELHRYVELTGRIRELSAPQLTGVHTAEDYRLNLLRNFTRIGELARTNARILNVWYYPLIKSDDKLAEGDVEAIRSLSGMLLYAYSMEHMDLPMLYLQSERLLKDAERKGDTADLILALSDMVDAASAMMYMTQRLYPACDVCFTYRDKGLRASERLLSYLAPERFQKLPDKKTKHLVLRASRMISSFFDRRDTKGDEQINERDLEVMRHALSLATDPFYLKEAPDFDWGYHTFRCCHNFALLTERNNENGYNIRQLSEINRYTLRMYEMWHDDRATFESVCTVDALELYLARNGYLAQTMTVHAYRDALRELIMRRDPKDFSAQAILLNLLAPLEWALVSDAQSLTEEECRFLDGYYRSLEAYVYHIPKKGSFSFMLRFLTDHLQHFIRVPGGMDFETFCLHLMAALHPPTYIHSLSVADFAACLTTHLLKKDPACFVGTLKCKDVAAVKRKKKEIIEFVRHAALMHDVGKLFIIETILTYGRELFDGEQSLINAHPEIGAHALSLYPETKRYAEIALGHHRTFDNKKGYPASFDMERASDKAVLAIVACADCLDASTDAVGRSYKDGLTFEGFLKELRAGSGTLYAPYVVDLFEDESVRADIEALIAIGRDDNYRETYRILEAL